MQQQRTDAAESAFVGESPGTEPRDVANPGEPLPEVPRRWRRGAWLASLTSLLFILLQSACTAVIAISGIRVAIGLSSLAAAAGLNRPSSGFHADAIRIPMMLIAVAGSLVNLYVLWRIRSLRARPASQWRRQPVTARQRRGELLQIGLAVVTLLLVAAEWHTHHIVHNAP